MFIWLPLNFSLRGSVLMGLYGKGKAGAIHLSVFGRTKKIDITRID